MSRYIYDMREKAAEAWNRRADDESIHGKG